MYDNIILKFINCEKCRHFQANTLNVQKLYITTQYYYNNYNIRKPLL